MRSCLQDALINSAPRIGKIINKPELYRHFLPRRVKDSHISEIENDSCVRNVMKVTPLSGIERVAWGPASILKTENDGVYICTCNVQYVEYNCWTRHAFVYDIRCKPLHQTKCCGVLIDNRADAPICVLEDKDRESKKQLDHALKEFFGGKCHLSFFFSSGHRNEITCSLLGGLSKPRAEVTRFLDSVL